MDTQTSFFLLVMFSIFIAFMCLGYMSGLKKKVNDLEKQKVSNSQTKKPSEKQSEPKQDDLEKVLNKLFANSIITQQQYNQLLVKGLPYFK